MEKIKIAIVAVTVALVALTAQPAAAQTIGFAEAYDRLAKSCGKDIDKLCANAPLGGGAVKSCLEKNQSKVSEGCKAVAAETFMLLAKREAAQANAVKVCDRDISQYCSRVQPHDGYVLQCLLTSTRVVSTACKQIIVDAGWN